MGRHTRFLVLSGAIAALSLLPFVATWSVAQQFRVSLDTGLPNAGDACVSTFHNMVIIKTPSLRKLVCDENTDVWVDRTITACADVDTDGDGTVGPSPPSGSCSGNAMCVEGSNLWLCSGGAWVDPVNTVAQATSTTDCTTITSPSSGALCYDTDDDLLYIYDGSAWSTVIAGGASAPDGLTIDADTNNDNVGDLTLQGQSLALKFGSWFSDTNGDGTSDTAWCGDYDGDGSLEIYQDLKACTDALVDPNGDSTQATVSIDDDGDGTNETVPMPFRVYVLSGHYKAGNTVAEYDPAAWPIPWSNIHISGFGAWLDNDVPWTTTLSDVDGDGTTDPGFSLVTGVDYTGDQVGDGVVATVELGSSGARATNITFEGFTLSGWDGAVYLQKCNDNGKISAGCSSDPDDDGQTDSRQINIMVQPGHNIVINQITAKSSTFSHIETQSDYTGVAGTRSLKITNSDFSGTVNGYCFHFRNTGDFTFSNNSVRDCDTILSGADEGWQATFGAIEHYCSESLGENNTDNVIYSNNRFDNVYQMMKHVPLANCSGSYNTFSITNNTVVASTRGLTFFDNSSEDVDIRNLAISGNSIKITGRNEDETAVNGRTGIWLGNEDTGVGDAQYENVSVTGNTVFLAAPSQVGDTTSDTGIYVSDEIAAGQAEERNYAISNNAITVYVDQYTSATPDACIRGARIRNAVIDGNTCVCENDVAYGGSRQSCVGIQGNFETSNSVVSNNRISWTATQSIDSDSSALFGLWGSVSNNVFAGNSAISSITSDVSFDGTDSGVFGLWDGNGLTNLQNNLFIGNYAKNIDHWFSCASGQTGSNNRFIGNYVEGVRTSLTFGVSCSPENYYYYGNDFVDHPNAANDARIFEQAHGYGTLSDLAGDGTLDTSSLFRLNDKTYLDLDDDGEAIKFRTASGLFVGTCGASECFVYDLNADAIIDTSDVCLVDAGVDTDCDGTADAGGGVASDVRVDGTVVSNPDFRSDSNMAYNVVGTTVYSRAKRLDFDGDGTAEVDVDGTQVTINYNTDATADVTFDGTGMSLTGGTGTITAVDGITINTDSNADGTGELTIAGTVGVISSPDGITINNDSDDDDVGDLILPDYLNCGALSTGATGIVGCGAASTHSELGNRVLLSDGAGGYTSKAEFLYDSNEITIGDRLSFDGNQVGARFAQNIGLALNGCSVSEARWDMYQSGSFGTLVLWPSPDPECDLDGDTNIDANEGQDMLQTLFLGNLSSDDGYVDLNIIGGLTVQPSIDDTDLDPGVANRGRALFTMNQLRTADDEPTTTSGFSIYAKSVAVQGQTQTRPVIRTSGASGGTRTIAFVDELGAGGSGGTGNGLDWDASGILELSIDGTIMNMDPAADDISNSFVMMQLDSASDEIIMDADEDGVADLTVKGANPGTISAPSGITLEPDSDADGTGGLTIGTDTSGIIQSVSGMTLDPDSDGDGTGKIIFNRLTGCTALQTDSNGNLVCSGGGGGGGGGGGYTPELVLEAEDGIILNPDLNVGGSNFLRFDWGNDGTIEYDWSDDVPGTSQDGEAIVYNHATTNVGYAVPRSYRTNRDYDNDGSSDMTVVLRTPDTLPPATGRPGEQLGANADHTFETRYIPSKHVSGYYSGNAGTNWMGGMAVEFKFTGSTLNWYPVFYGESGNLRTDAGAGAGKLTMGTDSESVSNRVGRFYVQGGTNGGLWFSKSVGDNSAGATLIGSDVMIKMNSVFGVNASTDSPPTCGSAISEALYHDTSLDEYCVCDGTNWSPIDLGPSSYGSISWDGTSDITHDGIADNYADVMDADNGDTLDADSTGFSNPQGGRLTYTGSETADFVCSASISFSGTNNSTWYVRLAKNGTSLSEATMQRKLGTGGDIGALSTQGLVSLATNDYIEVVLDQSATTTNTFTVESAILICSQTAPVQRTGNSTSCG